MRARLLVFALVTATVLAVPAPARPATTPWSPAIWSSALVGGPTGLSADARGAIVTTDAGRVRAIDRHGATQWETKVDGAQDSYPALTKDLVLVGGTGRVVALGRRHGEIRWQQPMDREVHAVTLAGTYALVGDEGGTLRAFAAADGAMRWEVRYGGDLWSSPQVDLSASVAVAVWHDTAPAARGLDLATGAARWEQTLAAHSAGPAINDGRAFLATGDGHYHARVGDYDVAGGAPSWEVRVPASFQTGVVPAVDAHDLVVIDQLGLVTAFNPATGTPRWTQDLNRHVYVTRVVLLARRVVVTTLSGELFVLDRISGRIVASADINDFGGRPILVAAFGRSNRILVSLRIAVPGRVELRRVP